MNSKQKRVLSAVKELEDAGVVAYGVPIHEKTGINYGSVYIVLGILHKQGMVEVKLAPGTVARGGHKKLLVSLTAAGRAAANLL